MEIIELNLYTLRTANVQNIGFDTGFNHKMLTI